MRRKDTTDEAGIWVRLELDNGATLTGFASGADSPNDFWSVFKTQLIRLEEAWETAPGGTRRNYPTIYVNRDRIVLVDVVEPESGEEDPPTDA
ncbi:MAG: hypothetical protein K8T90_17725 [Planctomycetes bacterium]|nr:hypothetical protein [Planctomycetota bacterium]